jgi:hypothetical protein
MELQRLLQEQAQYERVKLDQRAQAKVQEAIQQRQPKDSSSSSRKYYPKRRELKQMQWQAKLELMKGDNDHDVGVAKAGANNNSKPNNNNNKAVEKMVLKRRKRLKSKHAKKFL